MVHQSAYVLSNRIVLRHLHAAFFCAWAVVLGLSEGVRAESGPLHDTTTNAPNPQRSQSAPTQEDSGDSSRCQVSAKRIADFANGEAYDFNNFVNFITAPSCQANAREISRTAISYGVKFNTSGPYRLDGVAKSMTSADLESSRNAELALQKSIPALLRSQPPSSQEILPILGQLALLNQKVTRDGVAYLIQNEVQSGFDRFQSSDSDSRPQVTQELVQTLLKLGADRAPISNALAKSVEDQVLLEQASTLGKYFRGLALAATLEDSLVPTFNLSASGFYRAIQRTLGLASKDGKSGLLTAAYWGAQSAVNGNTGLEVGAHDFNESLALLLAGQQLTETTLRKLWKNVMSILAKNSNQTALADAVAQSITPQMIFLTGQNQQDLLKASSRYPVLARALQQNFLIALDEMWNRMRTKKIQIAAFNRMREKYFRPVIQEVLQFEPSLIEHLWLKSIGQYGLVTEPEVEKRFPRLLLAKLKRRELASAVAIERQGAPESFLEAQAEGMAILLSLSEVHLPTLDKWIVRQEK